MFTIGIIGRPNVGKSSMFNALLGFRRTIVLDLPGTTLDLISEKVKWAKINLMDSQGIFSEGDTEILRSIITKADALVFVTDAISGLTPFDQWIAKEIKISKKPTLLCVNKSEGKNVSQESEFASMGFDEVLSTSTAHRRSLDLVKEWCLRKAETFEEIIPEDDGVVKVALIGRPNTGKSTLMNILCKEAVSRVSPLPLTTRDPITYEIIGREGTVRLIDTAGIRRPRSKKGDIETFSIQASTRAIADSSVVVLCIASHEAITDQDMRLLSLIEREGRPAIVLLNFWDILSASERKHFLEYSEFSRFVSKYKILQISGKTGMNVDKILPMARALCKKSNKRTKTSHLNEIVEAIVAKNPPPSVGEMNFNILYASQVKVDPPTFVLFMNRKGNLPASYKTYIENQLKKRLGFKGQAVRVFYRAKERRERLY